MIAEPWEVFATQTVNERHFAGMGAEQCCRCEGPALVEFYRWDNEEVPSKRLSLFACETHATEFAAPMAEQQKIRDFEAALTRALFEPEYYSSEKIGDLEATGEMWRD